MSIDNSGWQRWPISLGIISLLTLMLYFNFQKSLAPNYLMLTATTGTSCIGLSGISWLFWFCIRPIGGRLSTYKIWHGIAQFASLMGWTGIIIVGVVYPFLAIFKSGLFNTITSIILLSAGIFKVAAVIFKTTDHYQHGSLTRISRILSYIAYGILAILVSYLAVLFFLVKGFN